MPKLSQVLMFNYLVTLLRIYSILEPQFDILGRYITFINRQRKAGTKVTNEISFVTDMLIY